MRRTTGSMPRSLFILSALLTTMLGIEPTGAGRTRPQVAPVAAPRVFLLDAPRLQAGGARIGASDRSLAPALDRLEGEARAAPTAGPFSVVHKQAVPPSGDKHDYMNQAAARFRDEKYRPLLSRIPELNPSDRSHLLLALDEAVPGFARWRCYRAINLDTSPAGADIAGDVRNYPVAVALDAGNFDFSQAREDGADLRFSREREAAPFAHAIEHWDSVGRTALVWVKVDYESQREGQRFLTFAKTERRF